MTEPAASSECLQAALAQATHAWTRSARAPDSRSPTEFVVLGDPQAPIARLFAVLDHHRLLTIDGWLRPDIGLISVGDHFDFASDDSASAGMQGVHFLAWLAAHDPSQVTILLGNHDVERVMSLGACSRADYLEAQQAGRDMLHAKEPRERRAWLDHWVANHPDHPPAVAAHDYRSFVVDQRDLVKRLLLVGRLQLAAVVDQVDGRPALVTHAGISLREHDILGQGLDIHAIAIALNRRLARAVDVVRDDWSRGGAIRLDLAPLYHGWSATRPNGGLLIHRPDLRDTPGHDARLGLDPPLAPRSQRPQEFLLFGVDQVVGHTVAAQRLTTWLKPMVTEGASAAGLGPLLRLARVGGRTILGTMSETADGRERSMTFVDVAMAITPPERVDLLRVRR